VNHEKIEITVKIIDSKTVTDNIHYLYKYKSIFNFKNTYHLHLNTMNNI